ncbi:prominin-1-like [Rhipicephalus microplus]|uniref:prominin-1-like n=1 Tax=Rhipicephalus microplus TaxID=6941 RepID=UPI003F6D39FC
MPQLQKTVEEYNRGGAAFRELTPGTIWNTNRQKLDILYTEVNSKDFPAISDYGILSFLNPYGDIFERGLGFGSNVCIAAFILQVVVTLSFAVGTWAHDPEIPPNKRGFVSNQSGITLVVASFFMWLFTTIMVPSSILYMMSGVIASKYFCDPYQNGDTQGFEILDNVTASLYVKGKWDPTENSDYELYNTTYKPGQVIV